MNFDRFHIGDPKRDDHFAVTPDEKDQPDNEDAQEILRATDPDNAFHHHLKQCEQCRTQPFGLCAKGTELLLAIKP